VNTATYILVLTQAVKILAGAHCKITITTI